MVLIGDPGGSGKAMPISDGVVGADILGVGQLVVTRMLRTTGSGDPDDGEAFGQGALQFGAAAAYAEPNRRQADCAASIAVLDRGVHMVLAREAQQVSSHRENLDSQATHLARLRHSTSIAQVPGVGRALTAAFVLTAVNAALGTCSTDLHQLTREVRQIPGMGHPLRMWRDLTSLRGLPLRNPKRGASTSRIGWIRSARRP